MRADEHPEDLIDRARRGGLAPEEQAALEQHLASCSVCAGQVSLAPRFEQELAAQPRDQLLYQRAVEGAIQRMQRSPPIGRRRHLPRWSRWAAAAALLVFGVTGAAAVIRRRMSARPAIPSPVLAAESPARRAPVRSVEPAVAPDVERPVEPGAPVEAPAPAESRPARAAASAHGSARPAVTAEALFEQGEKLRREGSFDAAIATYRRLQARFPATSEARLSFALAGQLFLERGRPNEALAQFDRHLGLDGQAGELGQVGEEALAGRATALEQLHRTPEAVNAWKRLLARYPRSVYAERARARLDQLLERR